jgi:predicted aspartyl protease
MVKSYPFRRTDADDLIIVEAYVNQVTFPLVVDTGASHTVIDFGVLVDAGYRLGDTKGIVPIETANGIISANLFQVNKITVLGIEKQDFEVCSYLLGQPEDEIKGVVGLDFFENKKICLDFKKSVITIT